MIGDLGNEFGIVGDDDDDGTGISEFTHYSGNRDKVLVANTGRGLVENVDLLVRGKRCSNDQALALPARQRLRMVGLVLRKVEFFKDRVGIDVLLFGFGRAERDFVNDCVREQLPGGVLHHKVCVPAGEFLSIECDGRMLGLFKSADDTCQC